MKLLLIIAAALLLGAGLIWFAEFEPGFVLLQYGSWSIETSLIVFVIALTILLVAGYFTLRSLVLLKQAPKRIHLWNDLQRKKRAGQALTRGLILLEEGRWVEAERVLVRHASNSETPLLHYLAAARSAQKQDASERRDNYLRLAHQTTEGADIAVGVVQAELQLAAGQKEQALATLQHLRDMSPKHPYVLKLIQQLYQELGQWQDVQAVLPDLRKRHVMPNAEVKALGTESVIEQLNTAVAKKDWQSVSQLWQQSSSKERQTEALLVPYVEALIAQQQADQACELIEQFLSKQWSQSLIYKYGLITEGDILKRLARVEVWLHNRQDNAQLLLAAGRLAAANKLWVKAEEYLMASVELDGIGESYQALADVLSIQNKNEQAATYYQQGLAAVLKSN
jgi:HemY protein